MGLIIPDNLPDTIKEPATKKVANNTNKWVLKLETRKSFTNIKLILNIR